MIIEVGIIVGIIVGIVCIIIGIDIAEYLSAKKQDKRIDDAMEHGYSFYVSANEMVKIVKRRFK